MLIELNKPQKPKIAIIGTGIAGLSAAWLLHKDYDITIFEKAQTIGGHSHSVNIGTEETPAFVDMGFIVFNEPCYPNLVALFKEIGAQHELSNMSFGVSSDEGNLEYSSLNIFAQKRNYLRPRFLRLLLDIAKFYKAAPKDNENYNDDYSLGDYLKEKNYSQSFIDDHLVPQAAAIWSTSAVKILDYPFNAFIKFFNNHGLFELDLEKRIKWRTITNGSQAYVEKLIAPFKHKIICDCEIIRAKRVDNKVHLFDGDDFKYEFDEVIFASHANETLEIIENPTPLEKQILSSFKYTPNQVVLHADESLMPNRKSSWASWNYIGKEGDKTREICVSYWMNLLQNIKGDKNYFVTLNPIKPIDESKIIKTMNFEHPLFDAGALQAQQEIHKIQGIANLWFCGAYMGSGFHEDGIQAGLAIAERLSGISRPWVFDWNQSRIARNLEPLEYRIAAQ